MEPSAAGQPDSGTDPYQPKNKVRVVSGTSLFDGHDASINIMRRILQASGAEVIHLGHNRTAGDLATAAVQEDAQAVAVTSYQGGHMEFYRYLRQLLDDAGATDVRIFGGGGGTILPEEAALLAAEGVARLFSPDDGRAMGFQGMINEILRESDRPRGHQVVGSVADLDPTGDRLLATMISAVENYPGERADLLASASRVAAESGVPVLGVTGTGGAGKSSLVDEIVLRFLRDFPNRTIAVLSVDPTRRRTGGALLGDRIRMNSVTDPRVFVRSFATRQANVALSPHITAALDLVRAAGYDLVIVESSGIGQSDSEIVDVVDLSVYVMTPEFGAPSQLEKIDMIDYADLIVINKADRQGAADAVRDVRKQYRRNRKLFEAPDSELPVYSTVASRFNDHGTNQFFRAVMQAVTATSGRDFQSGLAMHEGIRDTHDIVPKGRVRYLSEIAEVVRDYNVWAENQSDVAERVYRLTGAVAETGAEDLASALRAAEEELDPDLRDRLGAWDEMLATYREPEHVYRVRGQDVTVAQHTETLAHTQVPKVAMPRLRGWGDRSRWLLQENVPGRFPFTAGVFPFRRQAEDPTRMFAGEGGPEDTNRRFHYLSKGMEANRLSTAFDSVTLYGNDPETRPDIYGKVGNSGVSVSTLDDAKKLYSGFDLVDPRTSVSMTINGPAPMILAFFLNAAVDQQCEKHIIENGLEDEVRARVAELVGGADLPTYDGEMPPGHNGLGLMLLGVTGDQVLSQETYQRIKDETLAAVRGTVQADILKEDQAQNTCIFSTDFALRMQGDIQEYFVEHGIRNFYSVSVSGYHMAEAGANPITQLAFTLANGFTFVEYFRARGLALDDFVPNLSFFFSNGLDAEYAVIGRVARRIWAKAMKQVYGAGERSQKLKYHIQTSGRSLHAQEIGFNDIRTTLQALSAIYDNAQSLHTNAYDEAITTPTEESVRRALAIQLIINKELGLNATENVLQGSFIIEELTDLVEEAVLSEFDRLTERGGVLGAMETMYQRAKIQEESLYYEQQKASGALPIVGVNTYLSPEGSPFVVPGEVVRSTEEDRRRLVAATSLQRERLKTEAGVALEHLAGVALEQGNTFAALMDTAKFATLGQMSDTLYSVGGRYRRNM